MTGRTSFSRSRWPRDGSAGLSRPPDEGISASQGCEKRPGLDALLKGSPGEASTSLAAWSVCCLGRSLSDLVGLLGKLRSHDIDLYLHRQALDTSNPSGRNAVYWG